MPINLNGNIHVRLGNKTSLVFFSAFEFINDFFMSSSVGYITSYKLFFFQNCHVNIIKRVNVIIMFANDYIIIDIFDTFY